MKKQWIFKDNNDEAVKQLCSRFNIGTLAASVLQNRISDIGRYINLSDNELIDNLYDPFLLNDMELAVEAVENAVFNGDRITIYGDYDADGVTSVASLYMYLESIGAEVDYYVPERASEGYGINNEALDRLSSNGTKLIITVDTGISAAAQIEYAYTLGMEVIVTDHHECPAQLPDCCAVINPKRHDSTYPFKDIAGAGVVFKLLCALNGGSYDIVQSYIDLICLGTVADVMPITDENRIITVLGLKKLENTDNPGIRALLSVSGEGGKAVTASTVGFALAPRINACGRLGKADDAVRLLITDSREEAEDISKRLNMMNSKRQEVCTGIYEQAVLIIMQNKLLSDRVIVIAGDNWHTGVAGIVASKITERFYRPCIILCVDGETAKGSGRSIPGFDLYSALENTAGCLEKYGGHCLAAGVSLKTSNIVNFRNEINKYCASVTNREDFIPKITIDAYAAPDDLNEHSILQLKILEPFGSGNPAPVFCIRNAKITSMSALSSGKHMKLSLSAGNTYISAVGFGMGSYLPYLKEGDIINAAGNLEINEYNNKKSIQIILKDIKFSDRG